MNYEHQSEGFGPRREYEPAEMSYGKWMLTLLLCSIPVVNFVMLIYWAVGGGSFGRKNYSRAVLTYLAITVAFYLFLVVVFASFFAALI